MPHKPTGDKIRLRISTVESFPAHISARRQNEFLLPNEDAGNKARRAFLPFATLESLHDSAEWKEGLDGLTRIWPYILRCLGREDQIIRRFWTEKLLAASQVLIELELAKVDDMIRRLSDLLGEEAGASEPNFRAALRYQQELCKCHPTIGNSAYGIPCVNRSLSWFLGRLQDSYLPDRRIHLDLPEFELLRPAMLIYLLLGGAKSQIPFADIARLIERPPLSIPHYQFLPFLGGQSEELQRQHEESITAYVNCSPTVKIWNFPDTIQRASALYIAAWSAALGLRIPNFTQPTYADIVQLPENKQYGLSAIQVVLLVPYSFAPSDVILDSKCITWPERCALLVAGQSLWPKQTQAFCTIVWTVEQIAT